MKPGKATVEIRDASGRWRSYGELEVEMREHGWMPDAEYADALTVMFRRMTLIDRVIESPQ